MHTYTDRDVLPWLSKRFQGDFELIYIYGERARVGAWLHAANGTTEWCLLILDGTQTRSLRSKVRP
jgi:hypothetical protein